MCWCWSSEDEVLGSSVDEELGRERGTTTAIATLLLEGLRVALGLEQAVNWLDPS